MLTPYCIKQNQKTIRKVRDRDSSYIYIYIACTSYICKYRGHINKLQFSVLSCQHTNELENTNTVYEIHFIYLYITIDIISFY